VILTLVFFAASLIVLWWTHTYMDFEMQTSWQAQNKSKNLWALTSHVLVYSFGVSFMSMCLVVALLGEFHYVIAGLFWVVTFVTHWLTDFVTSRASSSRFTTWLKLLQFRRNLDTIADQSGPDVRPSVEKQMGWTLHRFFVVIGIDQAIHLTTLTASLLGALYLGGL
jgi:hypothetical protein